MLENIAADTNSEGCEEMKTANYCKANGCPNPVEKYGYCDICIPPTDTVTAVLNGQPIAITGEAATVIKQKNADIARLNAPPVQGVESSLAEMAIRTIEKLMETAPIEEKIFANSVVKLLTDSPQGVVISRECAEALSAFFPDDSFTATPLRDSINELQAALGDSK